MTIIEALEAARADGKVYVSSEGYEPAVILDELDDLRHFGESAGVSLTTSYEYREGVITGPEGTRWECAEDA